MPNLIKFFANKPWLSKTSKSAPSPTSKTLPSWYKNANKYAQNLDGSFVMDHSFGEPTKYPGWKSCPSVLDVMTTGYVLKTPCDIEFYKDNNENIAVKVLDSKYSDICTYRSEMFGFLYPEGYEKNHFAWFPDWNVVLPNGYSALYCHPINRFELPFFTVAGIIDSDKVFGTGYLPFFIKTGFTGIIKAETPYMQVIPFKRENWNSQHLDQTAKEITERRSKNANMFRKKGGGVYKSQVWSPRKYE